MDIGSLADSLGDQSVQVGPNTVQLDRDKAPGPDDFTIAVFQDCWEVIKEDLVRVFAKFHRSGIINQSTNASFIVLHLREVLHKTIHSTQGAFVQGRQILDAVLIANEIVNEKRRSGRKELSSKLTLKRLMTMLAKMLDCKASGWPILYLGLPLGGNPKVCSFWDPVIERISRRLDGWQKAYLSFGGRITLIQSCLTHMPCYFLSLFKIPALVAAKIERLQRDFLWSGVGEGKRDHLLDGHIVVLGRPLHKSPKSFSKFTRFVVGDGDRIWFWEDLWWGGQPLGVQYPRLLSVVTDKNTPISSILGSTRPFSWNFNFRRNLSDSEIEDSEGLMRSLDHLHISPSVPDMRSWSLSPSRLFTVKYFFLAISQFSDSPPVFPTKFVWNSQVPFKVKSFIWLVAHKKVNTNDLLQLRRSYKALSPDICACIALMWVVWRERNARIFEDKARNSENLWDSIRFLASLWLFVLRFLRDSS
ncbi:hypothetical protein CK203_021931 [Vitis vinifera]|uniref:Reverse transcriptase zinc-binding domain-containing protein n=1 Tax=Vitis vinifera TaxID=29760 RepID=A0A438JFS3_VITVI|nr:hypothetical protein CK203_021931 [Vitis vinifera]